MTMPLSRIIAKVEMIRTMAVCDRNDDRFAKPMAAGALRSKSDNV